MFYNSREKPVELLTLEELSVRIELSKSDQKRLSHLQKGFEGEFLFDHHLEKLESDCLILRDLLLNINGRTIQIDTLLILYDAIYLFEVKNYEGNYFWDNGKMYKFPNHEIINPLNQLERIETHFRQLMKQLDFHFELKPYVVFVHQTFTLYQVPLNTPFIFPTQIYSIIKLLSAHPKKLNQKHKALADKLLSLNMEDSPLKQIPAYTFDSLRKGLSCKSCHSYSIVITGRECICRDCGKKESVDDAVLRSVRSYKLLFPEEKVTTRRIQEWCGFIVGRKTILRILDRNFKKIRLHRWTYFE